MLVKSLYDGRMVLPIVSDPTALISKSRGIVIDEGWNEISENDWPFVEDIVLRYVGNGKMELNADKVVVDETDANGEPIKKTVYQSKLLNNIRSNVARDIIKGCFNLKNLESWASDATLSSELRALVDIQYQACLDGVEKGKRT